MIMRRRRGPLSWLPLILLSSAVGMCMATTQPGDLGTKFIDEVADDSRDGLQSLLNWAIENSSPEALSEMARHVGQELPQVTMEERRAQLAELVKESKMWPSDSEIMNTTLHLIANRSEPESTRVQGLRMLQDIVEDALLANGNATLRQRHMYGGVQHGTPISHPSMSAACPQPRAEPNPISTDSAALDGHVQATWADRAPRARQQPSQLSKQYQPMSELSIRAELPALGGVDVLADAMLEGGAVRSHAMRVLGTAAANNEPFQTAVLQREAGTVQWLLQAAADALYDTPSDAETLSAALKAAAAMARNLPPATTGVLRAHISHLKPPEAPMPSGVDPVDTLPESLQFLFDVVVRLQGEPDVTGEESGGAARARRNAAHTAMGLISDLAVNSPDVRIILQGAQAAQAWIDLCQAVSGARLNMVQKAVQLLAHMHQPHHAPPATAAGAWRAATVCLEVLSTQVMASMESGDEWAAEVLQELRAAADLLPASQARDEL